MLPLSRAFLRNEVVSYVDELNRAKSQEVGSATAKKVINSLKEHVMRLGCS